MKAATSATSVLPFLPHNLFSLRIFQVSACSALPHAPQPILPEFHHLYSVFGNIAQCVDPTP